MILRAGHCLVGSGLTTARWVEDGGLQIEAGRITRVLFGRAELKRAASRLGQPIQDLGDGLLLPGFVNAHAHLELSAMRLPSGPFAGWISAILHARRGLQPDDYAAAVGLGEQRLWRTGTTCVGDIASTAAAAAASRRLRTVVYREVLDAWDPMRTEAVMQALADPLPAGGLRSEGLSPHAPYTTSSGLLQAAAELTRKRPMPVSIHWSESRAELEWLSVGQGDFAPFFPASPRRSGLDLLEQAGLLNARTSLVHGNLPAAGEPERIAQAAAVLVHCPGTHQFFERAAFPWEQYRQAGVQIALGSDSRASNEDLDMRREMGLARAGNADLSPMGVLGMATHMAARALGLGDRVGSIEPGRLADLAFHVGLPRDPVQALDALTSGEGEVDQTFVGGRLLF